MCIYIYIERERERERERDLCRAETFDARWSAREPCLDPVDFYAQSIY